MKRITLTALIALVAFSALPASASILPPAGAPGATAAEAQPPRPAIGNASFVRAGNVYSARELTAAGLKESDLIEVGRRDTVQVRAGDVYSGPDLRSAGLDADDWLTVSNFRANGRTAAELPDTDPNR